MICSRFQGVDTIDLVLDFLAHQVDQLADLARVDVPRVGELDADLAADAPRVRVQHDDPVRQSDRFAHRVRDEEYGLARLHPQFLELLVQFLQAYVFVLLNAMYISGALADEH